MTQLVKSLPANAGESRDVGLIPESGGSPGEGNGNPVQYFCLGNLRERGAWKATVHGAQKVRHNQALSHTHGLFGGFPGGSDSKQAAAMEEMQEMWVQSLGQEDPLEKEMETHSSILTWDIPWDRGDWGLTVHGLQRVRHD